MGDDTAYRTVKEIAASAGIKRKVYPHLFRHTKLTQMGLTGMSQFELKEFSGHKTLDMLSIYVHPAAADIKRQVQSNPLIRADSKPEQMPLVGIEEAITSLTMRLATGDIDQDTYNRAMDSLKAIRLEARL